MYLAHVNVVVKSNVTCFAIIGKDSESILHNALKFGSEPVICSKLFKLNKYW